MAELDDLDARYIQQRIPKKLKKIMESREWVGSVFIAGGFIRSIVAREPINDIDIFVPSKEDAIKLSNILAERQDNEPYRVHETEFAFTVLGKEPRYQVIHRWTYSNIEDVVNSFDFTVCAAAIGTKKTDNPYDDVFITHCDQRFYADLAGKRLIYRNPTRDEAAGGSMLRVLKYYQRGYRISLSSLGAVMSRMVVKIDPSKTDTTNPMELAKVLTGLLVEVDPNTVTEHYAE